MLLTAGCSFVWGDELEGFDQDPPAHWGRTFTSILARKLGIDYVNRGICGACNDKIFREVTDFLHNHDNRGKVTHLVVMWSAWQRAEIVEYMPADREIKIGRQIDVTQYSELRTELIYCDKKRASMKKWYDTAYDSKTDIMHTISMMKALEIMCEAAGIELIQGVFHTRNWTNIMSILTDAKGFESNKELERKHLIGSIPDYGKWLTDSIGSLKDTSRVGMGRGEDMFTICRRIDDMKEFGHPGERTNLIFADFLQETFAKSSQQNV